MQLNKATIDAIRLQGQAATPGTPAIGFFLVYMKDDGKFYSLDDAGIETEIGGGGGGFTPSIFTLPYFAPTSNVNWSTLTATGSSDVYLLSSGAQNDEVTWNINLPSGTYDFKMVNFTGPNFGIYTVYIDGVSAGTIDGYGASGIAVATISGISITAGTPNQVKMKMATKNASSAGYFGLLLGTGGPFLIRTGA